VCQNNGWKELWTVDTPEIRNALKTATDAVDKWAAEHPPCTPLVVQQIVQVVAKEVLKGITVVTLKLNDQGATNKADI
jgi:hypothetical protein